MLGYPSEDRTTNTPSGNSPCAEGSIVNGRNAGMGTVRSGFQNVSKVVLHLSALEKSDYVYKLKELLY